ncbi:hypothetical protein [Acuticoccus kandeliae]|uniref:hypothetical protein n=1 Tax=Acuticoccus kandeliae TaxID=2073160 RepID=UPI000D3E1DFE|nr:hypothetical protein [Acuticoccus kandeliae]
MSEDIVRCGPHERRPFAGRSRVRAAAALLGLVLLYLGVALNAPMPRLASEHGAATAQAQSETRYLFVNRGDARATVASERADPRVPLLAGPAGLKPVSGELPPPVRRAVKANAPRAPPARALSRREPRQSRAPPSVTA